MSEDNNGVTRNEAALIPANPIDLLGGQREQVCAAMEERRRLEELVAQMGLVQKGSRVVFARVKNDEALQAVLGANRWGIFCGRRRGLLKFGVGSAGVAAFSGIAQYFIGSGIPSFLLATCSVAGVVAALCCALFWIVGVRIGRDGGILDFPFSSSFAVRRYSLVGKAQLLERVQEGLQRAAAMLVGRIQSDNTVAKGKIDCLRHSAEALTEFAASEGGRS